METYRLKKMKKEYQFLYRTEEQIYQVIKETGVNYPECISYIDVIEYTSKSESLEKAIVDFLSQDLGTIWDIDPEVQVGGIDGLMISVNAEQDYDKSWTINNLNKFSKL